LANIVIFTDERICLPFLQMLMYVGIQTHSHIVSTSNISRNDYACDSAKTLNNSVMYYKM
jgi:hypothetical protein